MMQLIKLFLDEGYKINFGTTAAKSERSAPLESKDITTHQLQLNDSSFDELLKSLCPEIVIFDRFVTEEQFGWRVAEICPEAIRILDTEDLHFLRKGRENAVKEGKPIEQADIFSDLAKRELASILRSDLSLIISEKEMELLKKIFLVPEGLLQYLPFLLDAGRKLDEGLPTFSDRKNFVTIGNFQHAPNTDGVQRLAKEIWPEIRNKLPNTEMHVYGAYAPKKIKELHNVKNGFLIKGWTPEVKEVMSESRVCLAPLRFGAGLKGKIIDAMLNGTPSVTTEIGAEGINGDLSFSGIISETREEFVKAAVLLYTDENKWKQSQYNGFRIIKQRFDKSVFTELFSKRLQEIQMNPEGHRKEHFIGQILQHNSLQATKYMSRWIELKQRL
jgi:glycosyltransferase involved in cell wall biosynthesis